MNNRHNKSTNFYANNIIHQTPEKKKKPVIPDTGATGNYLKADSLLKRVVHTYHTLATYDSLP